MPETIRPGTSGIGINPIIAAAILVSTVEIKSSSLLNTPSISILIPSLLFTKVFSSSGDIWSNFAKLPYTKSSRFFLLHGILIILYYR